MHLVFINCDGEFDWHFYVNKNLLGNYAKVGKGGWVVNSPKKYRIRLDKEMPPHTKKHIHIYKNGDFVVINIDGKRRHGGSVGVKIPEKLFDWIEKNFPDFKLPQDRIVKFAESNIPNNRIIMIINVGDNSVLFDSEDNF